MTIILELVTVLAAIAVIVFTVDFALKFLPATLDQESKNLEDDKHPEKKSIVGLGSTPLPLICG